MTDIDPATAVMNGAAWLDATLPGWEERINLDELSMARNCITDQVFGTEDKRGYDLVYDFAAAIPGCNVGDWLQDRGFLFEGRDEWIELIAARRARQEVTT